MPRKTPPKEIRFYDDKSTYSEFSNYYKGKKGKKLTIVLDSRKWPSSEHYYQAQKIKNSDYKEDIRSAPSSRRPVINKIIERYYKKGFGLRSDWNNQMDKVMYKAVKAKFTQNKDLGDLLLSTNNHALIYSNMRDPYWGNGGGDGLNKLGKILMRVRKEIISGAKRSNRKTTKRSARRSRKSTRSARRSRKTRKSRKSTRSARRSRKTRKSRKSTRSARRSRTSRKSRKSTRSARRSRTSRKSRKSTRSARRSRKTRKSRKSTRSARRSRKSKTPTSKVVCNDDEIYDPVSKKCVSVDSRRGEKLLAEFIQAMYDEVTEYYPYYKVLYKGKKATVTGRFLVKPRKYQIELENGKTVHYVPHDMLTFVSKK